MTGLRRSSIGPAVITISAAPHRRLGAPGAERLDCEPLAHLRHEGLLALGDDVVGLAAIEARQHRSERLDVLAALEPAAEYRERLAVPPREVLRRNRSRGCGPVPGDPARNP